MGFNDMRRFVRIRDGQLYEDPYLEARLAKVFEVVGLTHIDPRIVAIEQELRVQRNVEPEQDADAKIAQMAAFVSELSSPGVEPQPNELIKLLEWIQNWRRPDGYVEAFDRLSAEIRDQFTRQVQALIWTYAEQFGDLIEIIPVERKDSPTDSSLPVLIGVSLNPTLDIAVEVVEERSGKRLRVHAWGGGYPANLIQAAHALGVPVRAVMNLWGKSGDLVVEGFRQEGIPESMIYAIPGSVTRVSLMIGSWVRLIGQGEEASPSLIELMETELRGTVEKAVSKTGPAKKPPPLVAIGERLSEKLSIAFLVQTIEYAQSRGARVAIQGRAWPQEAWTRILGTSPHTFITPLDVFCRYLVRNDPAFKEFSERLLAGLFQSRPEWLAAEVETMRRRFGIQEWLVPFRDGSLIAVDGEKSWQAVHSPLLRLTYTSGSADIMMAAYLRARAMDYEVAGAARFAVAAGAIFMERKEEERASLPRFEEVWGVGTRHRTSLNELPRPLPEGLPRELGEFIAQQNDRYEWFHLQGFDRLTDLSRQQESGMLTPQEFQSQSYAESVRIAYMEEMFRRLSIGLNHLAEGRQEAAAAAIRSAIESIENHRQRVIYPSLGTNPSGGSVGFAILRMTTQESGLVEDTGTRYLAWLEELSGRLHRWEEQIRRSGQLPSAAVPLGEGGLEEEFQARSAVKSGA